MHPRKSNLPKKESVVPVCLTRIGLVQLRVGFDSPNPWKNLGDLIYNATENSLYLEEDEEVVEDQDVSVRLKEFLLEISEGGFLMTSKHELIELHAETSEESVAFSPKILDAIKTSIEAVSHDSARVVFNCEEVEN